MRKCQADRSRLAVVNDNLDEQAHKELDFLNKASSERSNRATMGETQAGHAMERQPQAPVYRYRVLIAVNDSPESRAALEWATENLIRDGDQVLLYHVVKTPKLIPITSEASTQGSLEVLDLSH